MQHPLLAVVFAVLLCPALAHSAGGGEAATATVTHFAAPSNGWTAPAERQQSGDDWDDDVREATSRDDRGEDKDLKASKILAGISTPMWIGGATLFALHPPILESQLSAMGRRGGTLILPTPAAVGLDIAGLIFATASWSKARDAYNRAHGGDYPAAGGVIGLVLGIVGTVISVATIASSGIEGGYEIMHAPPTFAGAALCVSAGLILSLDGHRLREESER